MDKAAYKKTNFTFEDDYILNYVGYSNGNQYKGYYTPLFTKEVCDQIVEDFNQNFDNGKKYIYVESEDMYVFACGLDYDLDDKSQEELKDLIDKEIVITITPITIEVDGEKIKVYEVGCDWTWEKYSVEDAFEYGKLTWEEAWQKAAVESGWAKQE